MSYEMYTERGNKACESMVGKVVKKIHGKQRVSKEEILVMVKDGIEAVQKKHPEVTDTEPEWHIATNVSIELEKAGYGFRVERWDL
jgi:hypothetical protein